MAHGINTSMKRVEAPLPRAVRDRRVVQAKLAQLGDSDDAVLLFGEVSQATIKGCSTFLRQALRKVEHELIMLRIP